MSQWTTTKKMALTFDKTKKMRICFKKKKHLTSISIQERQIEQVNCTRLLGVAISYDLTWQLHIDEITANASQRLYFIILLTRAAVEPHHRVKRYTTIIRSIIEYACQVWQTSVNKNKQTSSKHSEKAMCIIFREMSYSNAIATAKLYSRACSNLVKSCTISCLPLGMQLRNP